MEQNLLTDFFGKNGIWEGNTAPE